MKTIFQDIRFGWRMLRKNPGFTAVAVLTLALGIGASTAMFGVVDTVLVSPLPFSQPDRLVWIENGGPGRGLSARTSETDNLRDWREQTRTLSDLGAYFAFFDYWRLTLTGSGEPQRLRAVPVSKRFLTVLGIRPVLGRNFVDEECVDNGRPAVILSYAFWRKQFGGDPRIVGKSITLNGKPTAVVGVLPKQFDFDAVFNPGQNVDLLVPFPITETTAKYGNTVFAIGRLKPGVTLAQAQSEFEVICDRIHQQHPERGRISARITMLDDHIRGRFRSAFGILFGAVLCVLLIACVNLSNLLLARANARRKEFAVRAALGADRWRLARQTMTESLLLAMLGCAAAIPLAIAATSALANMQTFGIPLLQNLTVDWGVLGFTAAVSVLAGLLCGTLPALHHSRNEAREALNEAGARGGTGRRAALIRRALVISEVALACMLLVGAGLLIGSFIDVLNVNLGFQPEHAVTWRVDTAREFKSPQERVHYYERLVQQVVAVPGIESVGLTDTLPLGRNRTWGGAAKGVHYPRGQYPFSVPLLVDQHYLQTMRIPLLAGRYFNDQDTRDSQKAIIFNQTMARRLWPGQDALGKIVVVSGQLEFRVVGVVADVHHLNLEEAPQSEMYLDFRQYDDQTGLDMVVRTKRSLAFLVPAVRAAIRKFDPKLPSAEFTTLDAIVDHAVAPRRLITVILASFSSLALFLAAMGLYGVIAYSVGQRTREVGIRLAVGAQRGDVLRLIVGEGLKTGLIGVVLGLAASFFAARLLANQLFGVTATDPLVYAVNALMVTAVALLASFIPARRAAKIDPMEALRQE